MTTMRFQPTENKPGDPLVSILIYNYEGAYLRRCLECIFDQKTITNLEIILIDDATNDGSWRTALEFSERFPEVITVQRNRKVLGPPANLRMALWKARGRYCAPLTNSQAFLPDYLKNCVLTMMVDPYARFGNVCYSDDLPLPIPHDLPLLLPDPVPSLANGPLVSILCYNYNYGRYLRQCLESVFAQTYENIELCFSDNASTDESWAIALEFAERYPDKMTLMRNRKNFGPEINFQNCNRIKKGKYYINFCSDDVLHPEYVASCVQVLETHPNAGFALVNRSIIDEAGNVTEELPFYNQSCIIPGEEQAAVYMMAGVNPSVSQIMYLSSIIDKRSALGSLTARYYGTRILDFNIALDFDIAYLKEPLLQHRLHSGSDTSSADASLLPVIGGYVLNHQFADTASVRGLSKVTGRLQPSVDKLAALSVRYSIRCLLANAEETSLRYFYLAVAMAPSMVDDPLWRMIKDYWEGDETAKEKILGSFKGSDNLATRSVSYDPPPGSTPLAVCLGAS